MTNIHNKKRRRNFLLKLRPVFRWVLKLRSSSHAIAGGLGLGMFLAFTPTVGIQIILAVILATLLNVNRPAAMIPVWITNPVTVAPIYTFNYWLGLKFVDGPPLSEVSSLFINIGKTMARLEFWDIDKLFMSVVDMGRETLVPLLVGSLVIGLVTGVTVYLSSLKLLQAFLDRRASKRILNSLKPGK